MSKRISQNRRRESRRFTLAAATALFCALALFAEPAWADTFTWTGNGVGNSWFNKDNWDPFGIPSSTDDVQITLAGTYTVTTGAAADAASLTIGNAVGAQELEVTGGTLTVVGNVDIDANATLTVRDDMSAGGLLDVAVGGALIIDAFDACCKIVIDVTSGVTNSGLIQLTSSVAQGATLNVTAGTITNNSCGTITNNSGGTIDLLAGAGGTRTISGDVDNSGDQEISAVRSKNSPASWVGPCHRDSHQ